MVAPFARFLGLLLVFGIQMSCAVAADEHAPNARAAVQVREDFMRSLANLKDAMQSCDEKRKVIKLPLAADAGVSRNELLMGVAYYDLKTANACVAPAAKDFFLAEKLFEYSPTNQTEDEKSAVAKFSELILDAWWKEAKAKARYETQVSAEKRTVIEKIPGLREPFAMIDSWNKSGN